MSKNVQIPMDVFYALCDFFIDGKEIDTKYISSALNVKKKALERHTLYSLSKNAKLDEGQREHFRNQYLDDVGIKEDFRWKK